jgi:hypothetical protein
MEDPREDHWTAVKRLPRYIKGTVDQGIVFPGPATRKRRGW